MYLLLCGQTLTTLCCLEDEARIDSEANHSMGHRLIRFYLIRFPKYPFNKIEAFHSEFLVFTYLYLWWLIDNCFLPNTLYTFEKLCSSSE